MAYPQFCAHISILVLNFMKKKNVIIDMSLNLFKKWYGLLFCNLSLMYAEI